MRKRRKFLVMTVASIVAFAWLANVAWNFIDEGATPPESAFPDVPAGVVVEGISHQCGSGRCWLEMAIESVSTEAANRVINDMGLSQESCGSRNLLTWQRICAGPLPGADGVHVYLQYDY